MPDEIPADKEGAAPDSNMIGGSFFQNTERMIGILKKDKRRKSFEPRENRRQVTQPETAFGGRETEMDRWTFSNTYSSVKQIGRGGTGVIYKAYHKNLQKYVVLKKLAPEHSLSLMRREVDILKNLRHRYLPQVYDFLTLDGAVYTVEDYINGCDLETYLQQGRKIDENTLIKWLRQMCEVLEYLHTRNPVIIHSDIKPGNIMIDQQGDICLIDFNISILHDKNACVLGYSSNYCSPEQLMQAQAIQRGRGTDGITVDQRSDIYSTAATFYAVITGTVPQGSGRDRPLAQMPFLPYSREILRLLDKAMAPNPKDRFQDAREMLNMTQHLERLGERYGTYTVLRAVISVMGTALIAFGILCILQGRQTILKEELNQKYTDISLAYETDGATFEVYRDTAELLDSSRYKGLLKRQEAILADLYAMEGQYQYEAENYSQAAQIWSQALEIAEEGDLSESKKESYAWGCAQAYAMTGDQVSAAQVLGKYPDYDGLEEAIQAELSFSNGDYSAVLESAEQVVGTAQDREMKAAICIRAAQAAAKLDETETSADWIGRIMEYDQSDAGLRTAAKLYLSLGDPYYQAVLTCCDEIRTMTAEDYLYRAAALCYQGRYTQSLSELNRIQTTDTVLLSQIECFRGWDYLQIGDIEQAAEACEKAQQYYSRLSSAQREKCSGLSEQIGNLAEILQ